MRTFGFDGLHHVQLAMPEGSEEQARAFYAGLLGMTEVDKPAGLAGRGGCWFRGGRWELHLGVEADFRAASKAHPGVLLNGIDILARRLTDADVAVAWDENLPGHRRFHTHDCFGNRLEFLEPQPA